MLAKYGCVAISTAIAYFALHFLFGSFQSFSERASLHASRTNSEMMRNVAHQVAEILNKDNLVNKSQQNYSKKLQKEKK
jgi:hypothetical protein